MSIGWIVVIVLIALIGYLFSLYNGLVSRRNQYKNAFAQIDVQLTRRHDLIPNLVDTAKGYLKHEKQTLQDVINARNSAVTGLKNASKNPADPNAIKQVEEAEKGLSGALGKLFALSEAYPDLKANENMMQLSEELTATENKVSFARQAYNDAVMDYNIMCESVPSNFIANNFGFDLAQQLELADEAMRDVPKVNFDT